MKKLLLLLALLPIATPIVAIPLLSEECTQVTIIRKKTPPTPKSPEVIPIQVFLDTEEMLLTASASISSTIDVQIENITSGATIQDSFISIYSTPLPTSGCYLITFTLADGSEYYGSFIL